MPNQITTTEISMAEPPRDDYSYLPTTDREDTEDESEDEEAMCHHNNVLLLEAVLSSVEKYLHLSLTPVPCRTSIRGGQDLVNELLQGHRGRFFENARMTKPVFHRICDILEENGVQTTRRGITVPHQFLIFLFMVKEGASSRTTQEHFQHSGETISRHFHAVLDALYSIANTVIRLPSGQGVPSTIRGNPKFYPYFRDAIGAVDGTHIPVYVEEKYADSFRDKDKRLSQNVFAACDFSMIFQYVLAGWEGSAHDATVADDALRKGFRIPHDKYFLADAGFPICDAFLVPYRGVRYHLRETAQASIR